MRNIDAEIKELQKRGYLPKNALADKYSYEQSSSRKIIVKRIIYNCRQNFNLCHYSEEGL